MSLAARGVAALRKVRDRGVHRWLGGWAKDRARKALWPKPSPGATRHLLFAICDHFEPLHGNVSLDVARARVAHWQLRYPEFAARFRDSNGRPPRHSFFYPGDQYAPDLVAPLAELTRAGLAEVDVHLHHDGDTRATLAAKLENTLAALEAHGLVSRYRGRPAWAFIHGDWALANGRRDGRKCGVDDELTLLHELGCYADFTFPSAPDEPQHGIANCIYYPDGDLTRPRAYARGTPVRVGSPKRDEVLLVQGPLALCTRPGARSRLDYWIENTALDPSRGASAARMATWIDQRVEVYGRPEWSFVKVYSHGAPEANAARMLGDEMAKFHDDLARLYNDGTRWRLHYVTAREMFNVARAAMDGKDGSPARYFDYEIPPPPVRRAPAA